MTRQLRHWIKLHIPILTIIILITLLTTVLLWNRIVIFIHSGEAGVLYWRFLGGTQTDYVYPEGFHAIFPWDIMTIYNVRIQTTLHEFEVLTNLGLPIYLSLAIRFRPEYEMLGLLHQEVGPDYINTITIPQIESVLRKNLGHYNPEQIYINEKGFLEKIILLALEEAGQRYVIVEDILIRKVELPPLVKDAIEEKLVQEQHYKTYKFRLLKAKEEAKRKRIEATGLHDYNQIVAESLDDKVLTWKGIQATLDLSTSANAKVLVIGAGKNGLPIILNTETQHLEKK